MLEKSAVLSAFQNMFVDSAKMASYNVEAAQATTTPSNLQRKPSYRALATENVKEAFYTHTKQSSNQRAKENSNPSAPLSAKFESRKDMTSQAFKKILNSSNRAKCGDACENLCLTAKTNVMWKTCFTAHKVRRLQSTCPNVRVLVMENVNLRHKQKKRRVKLGDFSKHINVLSLRGSVIDLGTFFQTESQLGKRNKESTTVVNANSHLKSLDLGRCVFLGKKDVAAGEYWQPLPNLEELYLEGGAFFDQPLYLHSILVNCPSLRVLDLEGTIISDKDLLQIHHDSPQLRELYVGYTAINDSSLLDLETQACCFKQLETICLSSTSVTDTGLESLARSHPFLKRVIVDRSHRVTSDGLDRVKKLNPSLEIIQRVHTSTIDSILCVGCCHFQKPEDCQQR